MQYRAQEHFEVLKPLIPSSHSINAIEAASYVLWKIATRYTEFYNLQFTRPIKHRWWRYADVDYTQ